MPLSFYIAEQQAIFQIVAKKVEASWSEPTVCARILLNDGCEMEVQTVKGAFDQWNNMTPSIAHTMQVHRSCIKPYHAKDKTGISSEMCLRFAYKIRTLQRAVSGFSVSVRSDHTYVMPVDIEQKPYNTIFNVAGIVHDISKVPEMNSESVLPRRSIQLHHADWAFEVQLMPFTNGSW